MDGASGGRQAKVWIVQGKGPPPGYEWNVVCYSRAFEEARNALDEGQYEYIAMQIRELARHPNPIISATLDIDKVETFWELRDKGGVLGRGVNVRVYYDTVPKARVIRILGVHVKKNEGKTTVPVREKIKRRQQQWDTGVYPLLPPAGGMPRPNGRTGE